MPWLISKSPKDSSIPVLLATQRSSGSQKTGTRIAMLRLFTPGQEALRCWLTSKRACTRRRYSVKAQSSLIHPLATKLAERQPCLTVNSDSVRILAQPAHFYDDLLRMIRTARKRVFLSSLYIGSKEIELIDALHSALTSNTGLKLYMVLDGNRSSRPGATSTLDIVHPLIKAFPERVHISLFLSPKLGAWTSNLVPPRFREGFGTWHAKIYGADDDVIISGANLNKSYFTDRQDRYVCFDSNPQLANYCLSFIQLFQNFSYRLLPEVTSSISIENSYGAARVSPTVKHYTTWANPTFKNYKFQKAASSMIRNLQLDWRKTSPQCELEALTRDSKATLIFPIIQAGQFNIREEEESMDVIFKSLGSNDCLAELHPSVDLTSGYFGLYQPYQRAIINSAVDYRIIAASPEANGFFGSKGISKHIPCGYTILEQRFMRAVRSAGREPHVRDDGSIRGIELSEWSRDEWTYHAKGIWISPTSSSDPVLTVVGSTNLNSRSANLDTELSFIMVTLDGTLRQKLGQEVANLRQHAVSWKGDERTVGWTTRAMLAIVGNML